MNDNTKIKARLDSVKFNKADENCNTAKFFTALGFVTVKELLPIRVFDLLNLNGINGNVAAAMLLALYRFLNPNTMVDEAMYDRTMEQPFDYRAWRSKHKKLSEITVGELVLAPEMNKVALFHFIDGISKAFYKSSEYNWREYKYANKREYLKSIKAKEASSDAQ